MVTDGWHRPEEGWQWLKGRTVDLNAGEHRLGLDYQGGARLDVLVFSREDTPPDLAKLKSSYDGAVAGEVWTVPVKPFDVTQWRGVQFRLPDTVEVKYEYS